jgi:hypothetical protein
VLATINAIAERLTDERGLVYRYDTRSGADGLEGREGTFVLCTFWLALAGQPARARHVFERAITYLNDVGLLAEEVDPATAELLGNFPPRPSATSGSSTPPGPSRRPSAAASGLLVVDGVAGCDEAGEDPRDVALGDARRGGGSGGVAPTVGSCDAGST